MLKHFIIQTIPLPLYLAPQKIYLILLSIILHRKIPTSKRIFNLLLKDRLQQQPMKKQKDPKQSKRDALQSFLQISATPSTVQPPTLEAKKTSQSQSEVFQQYNEEFTNCNVCGCQLDPSKRKKCQFCSMVACSDHSRKRRKKKGKWQRICENCQDKYLYDVYMKLESKADEALCVEEEITTLKHDNFLKEVEERREKRREIGFKTMSLAQKYEEQIRKLREEQKKMDDMEQKVDNLENSNKQLEVFNERVTAAFKENYEQSWNILSEQNARMAKELTKLQKKAIEIKAGIQKKQKQIEDAFEIWSQKQFKKKIEAQEREAAAKKKKEGCQIY